MDFADLLRKVQHSRWDAEHDAGRPATASTVSAEFWNAFNRKENRRPAEAAAGRPEQSASPRTPEPAQARPPAEPIVLPSIEPSEIERELGLSRFASVRALQRLRREFALKNHPDRVPSPIRGRATKRMMIANAMIDSALKRIGLGPFRADRV